MKHHDFLILDNDSCVQFVLWNGAQIALISTVIVFLIIGFNLYIELTIESYWVFFMTWLSMCIFLIIPVGLICIFVPIFLLPLAYLFDLIIKRLKSNALPSGH